MAVVIRAGHKNRNRPVFNLFIQPIISPEDTGNRIVVSGGLADLGYQCICNIQNGRTNTCRHQGWIYSDWSLFTLLKRSTIIQWNSLEGQKQGIYDRHSKKLLKLVTLRLIFRMITICSYFYQIKILNLSRLCVTRGLGHTHIIHAFHLTTNTLSDISRAKPLYHMIKESGVMCLIDMTSDQVTGVGEIEALPWICY